MTEMPINTVAVNYNRLGGVAAAGVRAHADSSRSFATMVDRGGDAARAKEAAATMQRLDAMNQLRPDATLQILV